MDVLAEPVEGDFHAGGRILNRIDNNGATSQRDGPVSSPAPASAPAPAPTATAHRRPRPAWVRARSALAGATVAAGTRSVMAMVMLVWMLSYSIGHGAGGFPPFLDGVNLERVGSFPLFSRLQLLFDLGVVQPVKLDQRHLPILQRGLHLVVVQAGGCWS